MDAHSYQIYHIYSFHLISGPRRHYLHFTLLYHPSRKEPAEKSFFVSLTWPVLSGQVGNVLDTDESQNRTQNALYGSRGCGRFAIIFIRMMELIAFVWYLIKRKNTTENNAFVNISVSKCIHF